MGGGSGFKVERSGGSKGTGFRLEGQRTRHCFIDYKTREPGLTDSGHQIDNGIKKV